MGCGKELFLLILKIVFAMAVSFIAIVSVMFLFRELYKMFFGDVA